MQTFQDFADSYIAKATIVAVPENPNWDRAAKHYHVTLESKLGMFTTYYSVGLGIVESWAREKHPRVFEGLNKNTQAYVNMVEKTGAGYLPPVADVLEALQCDFYGVLDCHSFEEWAADQGLDEDSRKAERIFDLCRRQALKFKSAFPIDELLSIEG